MEIPFTVEQFLDVFEKYNLSVWPMQIVLNLFGIAAIVLAIKKASYSARIITMILAFLWMWSGIVYHLVYFTAINKAAYGFAVVFILQSLLFLIFGVVKPKLAFQYRPNSYGIIGSLLILYAMLIYPVLGYFFRHVYPPTFGVPCPTTIFTFGLLLWTAKKVPKSILVMPLLWSVIGFSAALLLGIREDLGLLIAGLMATPMIVFRDRSNAKHQEKVVQKRRPQVKSPNRAPGNKGLTTFRSW